MPLSTFQKFWITSQGLFSVSNSISGIFLSFFIWEKSHDFSKLLIYFLFTFLVIPIAGTIAAWISEKFSPKIAYSLGLVLNTLELLLVAKFGALFLNNLWFFGIVNGTAVGFFAIPLNSLQDAVSSQNLEKVSSYISSLGNLANIIVPSLGALLLFRGISYSPLFVLAALFSLASSVLVIPIKTIAPTNNSFNLFQVLNPKNLNTEKAVLFLAQFVEGIKGGFLWMVGGVIALTLVGNLSYWGIYNFIFAISSVILGIFIARKIKPELNIPLIIIAGIIFSITSLLLGVNFNLVYFIIYSASLVFVNTVSSSSYWGLINHFIREDQNYTSLRNEYFAAIEYPLALGRLIPILFLLWSGTSIQNNRLLGLSFVIIGIIPLLSFSILKKSRLWPSSI